LTVRLAVRVLRRAERQIAEASSWWDANRPKAPTAFREEVDRAFKLLESQPNVGTKVAGTRFAGVRRIYLNRIHYYLYYRTSPGFVEVLALWHTSRGSSPSL